MISTEAVASRESSADRSGLRSWLNRASLLPVATTECVLFGHDVELAGWRSGSRTGNWGLGALADDVALIVAEFSSSA